MRNANNPAYPNNVKRNYEFVTERLDNECDREDVQKVLEDSLGLSKREYFAAKAMQGYAASADESYGTPQEVAKDGLRAADALLKALEESQ